ncbi:hypothetical protein Cyast_1802 [Cyanobacterium stanieri PCC 7202]|uniref:Alpha amylase catalytic region n=1 Tax=Cyanobacterium stanieri (strain ATCC 29140 / PCC 7202) TaxID=292563 RepID=K9YNU8_CYASC|nr:hypothetical protein Cyast_1802 [Cyanobacterium stanieri PCC 7202]
MDTKIKTKISLVESETRKLINEIKRIEKSSNTVFEENQDVATYLGANYREDGLTQIGFWTPQLLREVMHLNEIYLEVFTPTEDIKVKDLLSSETNTIEVRRDCIFLKKRGKFFWGVVEGMKPGTRETLGSFYWLRYRNPYGQIEIIRDPLAHSLPFGVFAPAELYDMGKLEKERTDLDYFKLTGSREDKNIPRTPAPVNILQLHVGTASDEGTLAGLSKIYQNIAQKIKNNEPLEPHEEHYIGYDAVQLLPIEPTIEYRKDLSQDSRLFEIVEECCGIAPKSIPEGDDIFNSIEGIKVKLTHPNTQGWGYDVPILGASATSPSMLGSLRPDELYDFIGVLHNFPNKPIALIYDLVYGHADNQAELLINHQFFKGPNMYGQDLNHQLPMVRAILLEMQRRKINTGADGIRVDGGQDFRFFNPLTGRVEQDDQYLLAMSDLVQEIGGYKRLLFTIFEDGRPWPEEGWETKSTYMDLINLKSDSYQWGPLIFAHNTPSIKGFWRKKWQRVCEVMYQGQNWITGCGNHDTLRRGSQVDTRLEINWRLGETLNDVIRAAYDNPAVSMWVYGFSPGLPMDFINVLMHAPWMFFRNTDEEYGVKVVSEEVGFLDWQMTEERYRRDNTFSRMKSLGFQKLEQLREFTHALNASMIARNYDLHEVVKVCQLCFDDGACDINQLKEMKEGDMITFCQNLDIDNLKKWALMFMEDCAEICNVAHYTKQVDPDLAKYNLRLRELRSRNPWLGKSLHGGDRFNKIEEEDATIYYGVRSHPKRPDEKIVMVANLEGQKIEVNLLDWLQLDPTQWKVELTTPNLPEIEDIKDLNHIILGQSQGVLLTPNL